MIQVSEIFCSIQGESTFAGLPCIFIRLSGCNLRCNYCDSEYSFDAEYELSIQEIINSIAKYRSKTNLVEVTGGEPLIQKSVYQLFNKLISLNYKILLETNGSINLKEVNREIIKIVDVKCPASSSGGSFIEENLDYIDLRKDQLKFVLSNRDDYVWAKSFILERGLESDNTLFSCVFSKIDPKNVVKWMIEDGLKVRFQLQMHKFIWAPDQRGV